MSTSSSSKPSDMIRSMELIISYGLNPVNTISQVFSQTEVNRLVLGQNTAPITNESIINTLSNAESTVAFFPSLRITY